MPSVEIPETFAKILRKKPHELQGGILKCVFQLIENPRHPGLRAHRIQGAEGVWEAYVDKGNRVTFHYANDGRIVLRNNCNHDILTRNP